MTSRPFYVVNVLKNEPGLSSRRSGFQLVEHCRQNLKRCAISAGVQQLRHQFGLDALFMLYGLPMCQAIDAAL